MTLFRERPYWAAGILCSAVLFSPLPAQALDAVSVQEIVPAGSASSNGCRFRVGNDGGLFWVQLDNVPGAASEQEYAGGAYYFTSTGQYLGSASIDPISVSSLENWCGFSDVTINSQNGAESGSTLSTDSYMGVTFRATSDADGLTRDYEIGLSGVSGTTVINSATVVASNTAPTANAGTAQTVASGASVTVSGSGSDAESDPLTYQWTQTAGTTVSLTGSTTATLGFTAPTLAVGASNETLTFSLVVNDGTVDSAADTVVITVNPPANTAPVAEAGTAQTVASGASVSLSGSGTDGDGHSLTYEWTQTGGTSVSLAGGTTTTPDFTAPTLAINAADEVLTFALTVNDGFEDSVADSVTVTVTSEKDTTRPTVDMTAQGSSFTEGEEISVQVSFSEPVSGVETSDFLVSNATITGLTGTALGKISAGTNQMVVGFVSSVTLSLLPENRADPVEVQFLGDMVSDNAGNMNRASFVLRLSPNAQKIGREGNAEAMEARARALIVAQPDLRSLMHSRDARCFSIAVRDDDANACVSTLGAAPFWTSLQGHWSELGGSTQNYVNLSFGAHFLQRDDLILGAMIQFDHTRSEVEDGNFEGQGWLAGPYVVGRITNTELIYSASLLHGQSDNRLEVDGVTEGDFTSMRTLATLGLEGRYAMANGLTVIPELDFAYVEDVQGSYRDDLGNEIEAQTVTLSETSFGVGFEKVFVNNDREVTLTGGVRGVHSWLETAEDSKETFRARIDAGVGLRTGNLTSLDISVFYDGLGAKDYEAAGVNFGFEKRF